MAMKQPTAFDELDLEQDAFLRTLDPARNQAQPVVEPTAPPAALTDLPTGPTNTRETRDALGGYAPVGTMLGFNTGDYGGDTKARNSVKNTYGRIASRYDTTRPGFLDQILADADFQRYFPNARLGPEGGRGGMIDFGGVLSDFESGTPVGLVDVSKGHTGEGISEGHHWIDQQNAPAASGGAAGGSTPPAQGLGLPGMPGGDILSQIQQELQALIQGQPSDLAQSSFLRALR